MKTGSLLVLLMAAACARRAGPSQDPAVLAGMVQPRLPEDAGGVLAFPGALGWAARTPGGRGGAIVRVTNLDGDGSGSLVEALETKGPRIIVFEVGGVIDLDSAHVEVREPFLTLAGQTAPSPGITIIRGGITFNTHDAVIQHIRVRPGEAGSAKTSGWEIDALATGTGAHDVIFDHCSTTWATDENLSASGTRFGGRTPDDWRAKTSHRITISHSIIAEGLSESTHSKGEHSKGSLIHDNATDIAVIGNLYASDVDRSPLFKGGARGVVVNNYIHNSGKTAIKYNLHANEWGSHPYQIGQMVVVGNVFTYGANTPAGVPLVYVGGDGPCEVYLEDNIALDSEARPVPLLGGKTANIVSVEQKPLWPSGLVALKASELRDFIKNEVGARPWDRDAVDARIVREALSGAGKVINSERDVEGYPSPVETREPFHPEEWDLATMVRRSPRSP
jgi:hypothetical protein